MMVSPTPSMRAIALPYHDVVEAGRFAIFNSEPMSRTPAGGPRS